MHKIYTLFESHADPGGAVHVQKVEAAGRTIRHVTDKITRNRQTNKLTTTAQSYGLLQDGMLSGLQPITGPLAFCLHELPRRVLSKRREDEMCCMQLMYTGSRGYVGCAWCDQRSIIFTYSCKGKLGKVYILMHHQCQPLTRNTEVEKSQDNDHKPHTQTHAHA